MPKKARELGALAVSRIKDPGLHAVGGVAGLYLQVDPGGARSWILRITVGGRRRDIGLGGFPDVVLAGAREAARALRAKVAAGVDPVEERRTNRTAIQAAIASAKTFDECSEAYIGAQAAGWKNAKHAAQWKSTLATYASPIMGSMLVRDVEVAHVVRVLEPIWTTKTETATRVRQRIELVLDWATVRGYRTGLNPARWKANLDVLLPKPGKLAKVEHHAALAPADVPAFMVRLRAQAGTGARALEFCILTAARSGEVRGATWSEIDLAGKLWTIPAGRMKAGVEHRVPLSAPAIALLKRTDRIEGTDLVFPAVRKGQLSDMTLSAVVRRMGVAAVPHGFRSSFRVWCAEHTDYPREVAELALAHVNADRVESAYQRSDLLAKRAHLMEAWGVFCARPAPSANVIQIAKKPRRPAAR